MAAGFAGLSLYAFYRWQPQRIFIRQGLPKDTGPIDPHSDRMFSPDATILVVIAHPDDAEFYLGGTLARLHEHGAKIHVVVTTDGDKGYYPFEDAESNRRIRRQEQLNAALMYGCTDVEFLGHPDGRLRADKTLTQEIQRKLEELQPEYVLTFDSAYPPQIQHSDHLRTGEATVRALRGAHQVKWVLGFSSRAPNFAVDITNAWPQKRALLAVHASQFSGRKWRFIERLVRGRAIEDGRLAGASMAEAFRIIRGS